MDSRYQNLLDELKSIIAKGQYQAYKSVDNIKVQIYWQLGERIVREELKQKDRADYGKYLIDSLAIDLKIPKRRLYEIVGFSRAYPIVRTVSAQLSWSHYLELSKIDSENKRTFYQNKAVQNSWGVRVLRSEIKSQLYRNTSKSEMEKTFKTKLPAIEPYEAFKDAYNFNFLGLDELHKEKELEDKIILHLKKVLFEFGLPIATEQFRTLTPIRFSQWPQTLPFEFLVKVETDPSMHIYAGKVLKIHFLSITFWMW